MPVEPEYYPEFQYKTKGFIKDIFLKKRSQKELQEKLDTVLRKYKDFENPYFINYFHLIGQNYTNTSRSDEYSQLQLFENVLLRVGFDELQEFPELLEKLVRSTAFRFLYEDFVNRTKVHISDTLKSTLYSWIDERSGSYRNDVHLLLYYLWKENKFTEQINFSDGTIPLIDDSLLSNFNNTCEKVYFDILVSRFKSTLENFDPSLFITMYAVDAMSGYDFEDFLSKLFTTIGYDVQVTKRSSDQGADLFAEKFGKKVVIQAKNYRDNVGNAAIQQVLAAKTFYRCDDAMVVTNSFFTPSAKELAESGSVRLINRKELQKYLDEYNQTILESAASKRNKDVGDK